MTQCLRETTQEEREQAMCFATANVQLEGYVLSDEYMKLANKLVYGEINFNEFMKTLSSID